MAGWHHWLDGHESEWTPVVGDRQGGLACCDSWGRKESDTTERLNWLTDWILLGRLWWFLFFCFFLFFWIQNRSPFCCLCSNQGKLLFKIGLTPHLTGFDFLDLKIYSEFTQMPFTSTPLVQIEAWICTSLSFHTLHFGYLANMSDCSSLNILNILLLKSYCNAALK